VITSIKGASAFVRVKSNVDIKDCLLQLWKDEGYDVKQRILENPNIIDEIWENRSDFKNILKVITPYFQDFFDKPSVVEKMSECLINFASELCPNLQSLSENDKQNIFNTDGRKSVGILLYEFATGTGPTNRYLTVGESNSFVKQYLSGYVLDDILQQIYNRLNSEFKNNDEIDIYLKFSPDQTDLYDSAKKHIDSNLQQIFVGASVGTAKRINEKQVLVTLSNRTSKSSLFLHLANDKEASNKKLKTIQQTIRFIIKNIDENKFLH
ncbi:MAG: hypothetical protein J6Z12_06030, partial [Paludibacteraceae bacterium]|nr:hypothetical protein [Paludibacteraceae bacterium]